MKNQGRDESSAVAVEKQKTLRLLIVLVITAVVAIIGFYIVSRGTIGGGSGKVDVNLKEGKVSLSLEKPLVEQVGLKTETSKGSDVQFTEGKINDPAVRQSIANLAPSTPTSFSGRNFINRDLGFLLAVPHPERWKVSYNPAGLQNPAIPVNTISSREGAHLNIGVSAVVPGLDVQSFVGLNIQQMLSAGGIYQMPVVTYDIPSHTAFAVFTNPMTGGQSYMKVVINSTTNRAYVASANYNQALSSPAVIQDLVSMVSTFTLF
jgi:hypothetical protein